MRWESFWGVRSCPQVINTSLSLSTIQIHVNWCLINIVLKKYSADHHQTLYIACSCVAHLTVQIMGHSDVWKASNSKNAHMLAVPTWWVMTVYPFPLFLVFGLWGLSPKGGHCHKPRRVVSHVTPVTLLWHIFGPYRVILWKSHFPQLVYKFPR